MARLSAPTVLDSRRVSRRRFLGTTGAGVGLYTVVDGRVSFDPSSRPTVYPIYTT